MGATCWLPFPLATIPSAGHFGQRPAAFNKALQGGADVAAPVGGDEAAAPPDASLQMASETWRPSMDMVPPT